MSIQNYQKNQKGYNVTFWFQSGEDDRIETMFFSSRLQMLRATLDAEKRGCFAWQVTFLSTDH